MPVLKPISGHTKSVRKAIEYLTKKERALASDYINCSEIDRHGNETWKQMDDMRRILQTDTLSRGHKRVRTYEHFVLSPDPRDNIDLETLRDLAVEWAETYFGSFQVAIYYHDDNELGIMHAHLIVNNPNLDNPPGRVSTILTNQYESEMFAGLQRMASERGLRAFTEEATSVNHAEWAQAERGRSRPERPKHTIQPTYRSKQDKELESRNFSWKADVRDRMATAIRLASNEEQYLRMCELMGLKVRKSTSRRNNGEYVYCHPYSDSWEVTGARLGSNWSNRGVQRRLAQDRFHHVPKPSQTDLNKLEEVFMGIDRSKTADFQIIGFTTDESITAKDVLTLIDVCTRFDIKSRDDFADALQEPMAPNVRDAVRRAYEVSLSLNYLPQSRDKVDGRRLSVAERAAADAMSSGASSDGGIEFDYEDIPSELLEQTNDNDVQAVDNEQRTQGSDGAIEW